MKALKQFYGIFLKECTIHGRSRLSLLTKLLVGPAVSVVSTVLLFGGFFRHEPAAVFGEMTRDNYVGVLVLGFLVHSYLNYGYYFFAGKLIAEWQGGTFPLVWLAPCRTPVAIAGLSSVEGISCVLLTVVGLGIVQRFHPFSGQALVLEICAFLFVFLLGIALGWLRSLLAILYQGLREVADVLYLVLVFTSCPYVPRSVLPVQILPLVDSNPAYHASFIMRQAWLGREATSLIPHFACLVAGATGGVVIAYGVWRGFGALIQERTCR